MTIKTKWKRNFILMFSMFAILISMLSPALAPFADSYEDAQREFDEKSSEYLDDAEEAKDVVRILDKDAKSNPNPDRNTINYVMKRLLYPGVYINDVRDGIIASELDIEKDDVLYDGKYACNPNAPNNLINHNCNIPNFTTGLIQNMADSYSSSFTNAERTDSYSIFGLGVPKNIPGGVVPILPESRTYTYTALELYGYDLKLTSYNGEWDRIVVSNSARMLSNFGVIDSVTLVGTSLWNGAKAGVASFVDNFSFNPVRWIGNIGKSFESAAAAGINTVADTSDLNIVVTNAWKRPRLDDSLYNVYVMSDLEVLRETARNYFAIFTKEFNIKADENPVLQETLALNPDTALAGVKKFVYDPNMETEESKTARENAEKKRAEEIAHNDNERYLEKLNEDYEGESYTANIIEPLTTVPEPIYYTESEQLGLWEKDPAVASLLGRAKNNNLISGSAANYGTYEEFLADWQSKYTPYFESNFDAMGETVKEILEQNDADVFSKYPHLDPKQSISRYACVNSDGTMKRKADGTIEYYYTQNNLGSTQYINPNCSANKVRSPIGGGLFGNGWNDSTITDTRHVSNFNDDSGIFQKASNLGVSTTRSINSFIAKITNVVLDISYSPILEKLGLTVIVSKFVEGFRDTVFFPLSALIASVGALLLFLQLLRSGSAWKLLGSFAITLLIFIAGTTFLLYPDSTMKLVDEVPSKLDQLIADTILVDDEGTSYCSAGSEGSGVRSAQCNVWGAMVFEPWVHLQFGTSYNNLYAKGYAPSGGNTMENTNESLVGKAEVNMGGGKIVNNWALYQLSKTKSGTINAHSPKTFLGVVDKDLYRLVDLQAGPKNGAGTDSRYFETWSGQDRDTGVVILTLIQAIVMSLAIILLAFAKIEVTFMFAISIIFLPVILLYSLIPSGRNKLKGYFANLLSLFVKKLVIAAMLAVLLKIITLVYVNAPSLQVGAISTIFISLAFIIYRKEILDLLTSNQSGKGMIGESTEQLRNAIKQTIPDNVKQSWFVMKAQARGATAGFLGGALGATEQKFNIRSQRKRIDKELSELERIEEERDLTEDEKAKKETLMQQQMEATYAAATREGLSQEEMDNLIKENNENALQLMENDLKLEKLVDEGHGEDSEEIAKLALENEAIRQRQQEIAIMAAGGVRKSSSALSQGLEGLQHSRNVIGRTAERRIRSQGYAPVTAYKEVKRAVYAEGADSITDLKEPVEYDVYREILSKSENNSSKSGNSLDGQEKGQLAKDPKLQKKIRELADERRKAVKEEDYTTATITPQDVEKLEQAAKIVDKRRRIEKVKLGLTHPISSIEAHQEDIAKRNQSNLNVSHPEEIRKALEKYISDGGKVMKDSDGNIVVKDYFIDEEKQKMYENSAEYQTKANEILKEIEELRDKRKIESQKNEGNGDGQ